MRDEDAENPANKQAQTLHQMAPNGPIYRSEVAVMEAVRRLSGV